MVCSSSFCPTSSQTLLCSFHAGDRWGHIGSRVQEPDTPWVNVPISRQVGIFQSGGGVSHFLSAAFSFWFGWLPGVHSDKVGVGRWDCGYFQRDLGSEWCLPLSQHQFPPGLGSVIFGDSLTPDPPPSEIKTAQVSCKHLPTLLAFVPES